MDPKIEKFLDKVQKPGRYIGNEYNAVFKDAGKVPIKIALAFPDLYEIGMSHLGVRILYDLLNREPEVLCERVFCPWTDMEALLRESETPLSTLETGVPLGDCDVIGFSLQYELSYTNVLNMLDLAGLRVSRTDRKNSFPLIIGGGPCTANAEPVADFFDAFIIGDSEESFVELVSRVKAAKKSAARVNKQQLLLSLSDIEGVYLPEFYDVKYDEKKTPVSVSPNSPKVPAAIKKAVYAGFEKDVLPQRQLVPLIKPVHDRLSIEIMRGCPRRCKFCQASVYYGPQRKRRKDLVLDAVRDGLRETGYEEVSLLSLSSGDHPESTEIMKMILNEHKENRISVSMPSLRVEDVIRDLPGHLSKTRKTGLTFAPEAGSERLRREIGKNVDLTSLNEAVKEAYRLGYRVLKLYFMIGLPTEKMDDLEEMVDLVYELVSLRKGFNKKPPRINLSISTFIPKPHTKYEREGMAVRESILEKQRFLRNRLGKKYIKLQFTDPGISFLESALARGSRRLSDIVFEAWENGARFDGWREHFRPEVWKEAFKSRGLDLDREACKSMKDGKILPWGHIKLL